jgi:SAM-dependent methyltransferase
MTRGSGGADFAEPFAPERHVRGPEECFFYHTMDLPGIGVVPGEWDLRGSEDSYLGNVELNGRTVLEIGPASGYLSFWMERQGANVVAYDLNEHQEWDLVPYYHVDLAGVRRQRSEVIRRLNNSWWFARERLQAAARCIYGSIYQLDESAGHFDIVTVNSVLLHIRDPFLALQRAAARCRERIVVTDVSERQFAGSKPGLGSELCMHFIPRAATGTLDAWWYIPSALTKEMLTILGFTSVEVSYHQHKFKDGHLWDFYTAVGIR